MEDQNTQNHAETISEIRDIMERSSRFMSLSGLSGILAGTFALLGAAICYWKFNIELFTGSTYYEEAITFRGDLNSEFIRFFTITGFLVLVLSVLTGIYFTTKNARKKGLNTWDNLAKRTLINLAIPLVAGGVYCVILLYHGYIALIAPSTLLFYGLALLNASKYTLNDIRYLGLSEIALGILGSFYVDHGLLLWSIGFGVLHIVYGSLMYFKYER